jgi:hypothetical protein
LHYLLFVRSFPRSVLFFVFFFGLSHFFSFLLFSFCPKFQTPVAPTPTKNFLQKFLLGLGGKKKGEKRKDLAFVGIAQEEKKEKKKRTTEEKVK